MKCAVIGASDNSDRYANKAALMLMNHGHEVDLYGLHPGNIQGVDIRTELEVHQQVHTVTMYVSPMKQAYWMDLLLQMKPVRVIFNPGTENPQLQRILKDHGIICVEACTLVLLTIGSFNTEGLERATEDQ